MQKLRVINPKTITRKTEKGEITTEGVVIRTRVDYEDFVLEPGSMVETFDYRARRLQDVYPWLILEEIKPSESIIEPPIQKKSQKKNNTKHYGKKK